MRGNYAKASRLLRPLAAQGNTDAQVRLTLIDIGAAHKKGDYATAVRRVRPLAEQGNVHAQARLAFSIRQWRGRPAGLRGCGSAEASSRAEGDTNSRSVVRRRFSSASSTGSLPYGDPCASESRIFSAP
jgi:TPR repeat protein